MEAAAPCQEGCLTLKETRGTPGWGAARTLRRAGGRRRGAAAGRGASICHQPVRKAQQPPDALQGEPGAGQRSGIQALGLRKQDARFHSSVSCQNHEGGGKTSRILWRFSPEPAPHRETREGSVWSAGAGGEGGINPNSRLYPPVTLFSLPPQR